MRGISFVFATVAVVVLTANFRVEGAPRPQQNAGSSFTIVDGFAFDGEANRSLGVSGQTPTVQPTTVSASVTTVTPAPTTVSTDMTQCLRRCRFRVTAEFNPVCGTNGQGYDNPGLLKCAANCGQTVSPAYMGPCGTIIRG